MTTNLTKQEAIEALSNGFIVTHKLFTSKEWIRKIGGLYEFEDGIAVPIDFFWDLKSDESFLSGWAVLEIKNGDFYSFSVNENVLQGLYNEETKSFYVQDESDNTNIFLVKSVLDIFKI
jgi:hypothetical protein